MSDSPKPGGFMTPEKAALVAKQFGSTPEEVMAQWDDLNSMGWDKAEAEAKEAQGQLSYEVDQILENAEEYLDSIYSSDEVEEISDRLMVGFSHFFADNIESINKIDQKDLDVQRIIQLMMWSVWELAIAKREINRLEQLAMPKFIDGNRRTEQ